MKICKTKEWKGKVCIFLALVMALGFYMPMKAEAATVRGEVFVPYASESGAVTEGTLGENNGITWSYDAGTKALTLSGEDALHYVLEDGVKSPFNSLYEKYQIEEIIFKNCRLKGRAEYLFYGMQKVKKIDLSGLDTRYVTLMGRMFEGCSGLTSLDVSGFKTGIVTDMSKMFKGCSGLRSLDISKFDTGNVTKTNYMFEGCNGLDSLNVSGINTACMVSMEGMFKGCSGLGSLDVSGFDTGNVMSMPYMFEGCSGLGSLDVSGFNTGNTRDMGGMFKGCSGLTSLNVSGFNTAGVTDMWGMFYGCSGLSSLDLSSFVIGSNTDVAGMLENCTPRVLKAPREISKSINLSVTYFNEAGEERTVLTEEDAGQTLTTEKPEVTYRITYELNGGVNHIGNPAEGKSTDRILLQAPSRTGYAFAGWYRKIEGKDTKVTEIPAGNTEDIILYARWKENTYSIVFDGNRATGGSMEKLADCSYDKSYTLPANQFKRTGYTFTGWNTKKSGSGKNYKNKASVKNLTSEDGGTVTLYAQWKKNSVTYQIKFNGNGATSGKMSALTKCKSGKSYKLPANQFKKKGYTFAGWNTKKNGSGKSYKNKASVKNLTTKNGGTVTLYAQWKPITYTIKFDGNKASSGKMKDIKNCKYDKSFKLPKTVFKRKGYVFKGWNTRRDGSGKTYKNRAEVKNLTDKNGKTVVLYAQWKKAKK